MQEIIAECNTLISWVYYNKITNWRSVIDQEFPDEWEKQYAVTMKKYAEAYPVMAGDGLEPVGAIATNFSQLIKEVYTFILPSHIGPVIQTIRDSNKITQLGRGKGKVIILNNFQFLPTNHPVKGINPLDASELAKAVEAKGSDAEILINEVVKLREEVKNKQEAILRLQDQVNLNNRITWT